MISVGLPLVFGHHCMGGTDLLRRVGVKLSDIQKNSETDVEHKVTVPFLERVLGYTKANGAELRFRVSKTLQVGSAFRPFIPDIAVYVNGEPFLMIDSKPINKTIDMSDVNEAVSNGRLYEYPKQFPISLVSTGLKWEVYDTLTSEYLGDENAIPDINGAKVQLTKGLPNVPDYKKLEAERYVATLSLIKDQQKLGDLFKKCYTYIDADGKKFHEALGEISKIILAKLYEEQYAVEEKRPYRFSLDFLEQQLNAYPEKTATDIMNEIFEAANRKYKGDRPEGIFPDNSFITLSPGTVKKIVELLQGYAFYGAGEDIKGAVYETFLKEIFRGEKGQFFTPREVVRFMVQLVDPKPGERLIDPAAGSGGFLTHAFMDVRKKIIAMRVGNDEKDERINTLLERDLWGVDKTETLVQFCKINLLIHGDGYKNIHRSDSLDKNINPLKDEVGQFKIVLTNPPFDLPSEHLEHIIGDYELYKQYGYDGADVLFLERCYELLAPGGRMAMVVPHRFIDGKQFKNLRGWLLERMIPYAVVVLPVGVFKPFGGSNARTAVLYVRKPKGKLERKGKALMSTVQFVGFETGISEYKRIDENDLDTLSVGPELAEMKVEEETAHGV